MLFFSLKNILSFGIDHQLLNSLSTIILLENMYDAYLQQFKLALIYNTTVP